MKTNNMPFATNYKVAVNWLNNSFVLCNNIAEVDESIFENCRFSFFYYEDENGETYENEDEIPENVEFWEKETGIFQWFITDASEDAVEFLEKHFGLLFTYSDKLDCFVLCVDHYGTSWDYVRCETDLENAKCDLGESVK